MSESQFVTVHGHRRAYALGGRDLGTAPVLLLLHGLGCDRHTWDPVWARLAEHYTLLAPDLLGHGESAKPRGDYSPGGYANGMRDLLTILGIDKVTVMGHSFGGAVAMQFAYQFPERTERLVLVDPGGLGPEVTPLIRALGLPGYDLALRLITLPGVRQVNTAVLRTLGRSGLPGLRDLDEVAAIVDSFKDPGKRYAVHKLVSGVMDWRGQNITMRDRAYLTEAMPLCIVWGAHDRVLPVAHAEAVAEVAPTAQVTVITDAGHFPHKDQPEAFADLIDGFMASTAPASYSRAKWGRLLKNGGPAHLSSVEPASELA
ncbi:Pimeloyl-ACP methyl ester carboxylesterase [Nocardioides terrae]|uniref:Pimeloyl-ACP methyl ester carboxylesterase n=1 Tax=Nocardioides terrae TaxID=574651 RepID=A0A1I1L7Q6_9ACTN|nr:alpha/beta fold hydrolase [Nocardioides terrae]SFC69059.1 Pimeloyl-ACP methyl ester carboxylesterase [Nocardioides terrae]